MQSMNLGAGYDTFSYRQPKWAANLQIVELDHPATQKEKRAHFMDKGLKDPDNLAFAVADLENDSFGNALAISPMDLRLPIWISCLGVFAYLRKQTVHGIFETVAGLAKGLASCSTHSIQYVMGTMKLNLEGIKAEAAAQRRMDQHPTVLTKVEMTYEIKGAGLQADSVEKAIRMAEEKYCPVWAMLKKEVEITWKFFIV